MHKKNRNKPVGRVEICEMVYQRASGFGAQLEQREWVTLELWVARRYFFLYIFIAAARIDLKQFPIWSCVGNKQQQKTNPALKWNNELVEK